MPNKNPDDLLTMKQIALEFGWNYSTLRYWKAQGKFVSPDRDRPQLWMRDKVERWRENGGGYVDRKDGGKNGS